MTIAARWVVKTKLKLRLSVVGLAAVFLFILIGTILSPAVALPEEAYGIVSRVVDGDTIEVMIEKVDPRISSGVERIRLADVDSPEINTPEGIASRDFSYAVLLGKRVYLDIDDLRVRDSYNRMVSVVYLSGEGGGLLQVPCFNRMLVDSGHGRVENFTDNEFDPQDWWTTTPAPANSVLGPLEETINDVLLQLRERLAGELEAAGREIVGQIRGR